MVMLDQLQKLLCKTVYPTVDTSLEIWVYCRILVILGLAYNFYFDKCSSELAELVLLPYSCGKSTRYS